MKYVAKVVTVLQRGIHTRGLPSGPMTEISLAVRVEIELDGAESDPCMMYRYADDEDFSGDTWHQSLADAFAQAEFEYGLQPSDFLPVSNHKSGRCSNGRKVSQTDMQTSIGLSRLALLTALLVSAARAHCDQLPYRWHDSCNPARTVLLQVSVDHHVVVSRTLPLCRSADTRNEPVTLSFVAPKELLWTGYKDQPDRTLKGQEVKCDFWTAGGEPDGIILGLTFDSGGKLVMNALHGVLVDREQVSHVGRDIEVRTTPVTR